jgi:V/A-type H+/Na+-transporting ATPase subunit B
VDRRYLEFSRRFEAETIGQGPAGRTIAETLDAFWRLLLPFPDDELRRLPPELLDHHRRRLGAS